MSEMTDRQITHPRLLGLGPSHYECAVGKIERDTALLRQALSALEEASDALYEGHPVRMNTQEAIAALRERLEKSMEQKT